MIDSAKRKLKVEQRRAIFNAQRAIFIYASFHLMLGLFFLIYVRGSGLFGLLNISLIPIGLLSFGIWSVKRPYPAFIGASVVIGIAGILQLLTQNLIGLVVLIIVFYYVNTGRKISYALRRHRPELEDILDAELED